MFHTRFIAIVLIFAAMVTSTAQAECYIGSVECLHKEAEMIKILPVSDVLGTLLYFENVTVTCKTVPTNKSINPDHSTPKTGYHADASKKCAVWVVKTTSGSGFYKKGELLVENGGCGDSARGEPCLDNPRP